ncbi:MAG: hypothetical protein JXR73_10470 [Candidatus Omnitrophica bacterium]|nr:hypothetical protein [Candidatus Omnitrophota bacterium]
MAHCTEAFSRSLPHTLRLLFQPFRLIYWLKTALLVLLIQGFSLYSPLEYFNQIPQPSNMDQWAEQALEMMPLFAGILIGSILFAILMESLRACARFLLFDSVREGFIYYRSSLKRHISGILSLFLWNTIIKMLFAMFLFIAALLLLIPNWILFTMVESRLGLIFALTLDFLFGLFVLFLIIAHGVLLNGVVVPQMCIKSRGLFESWGKALRLIIDKPGDLIGFALIRLAVSMAMFLILFALAMLLGVFSVGFSTILNGPEALIENNLFVTQMQLPFQIVTTFLLLPIPIFQTAFALAFVAGVHMDQEYEPGGKPQLDDESAPAPTGPPAMDRSAPESKEDPFEGPISFKDIPTDAVTPPLETPPPPGGENSLGDQPPHPPDKSPL